VDAQTTIGELRQIIAEFVEARNWEGYHSPKNLAASIVIEAGELLEPFQWLEREESINLLQEDVQRQAIADELADVVIYCLCFANATGLDVSEAVARKMARNQLRFPPGAVWGKLG
jgi:dCTP diphosphatase